MERYDAVEIEEIREEIFQENKKRNVINDFPPFHAKSNTIFCQPEEHRQYGDVLDLDGPIYTMRTTAENRAFRQIYSCRKYIGKLIVFAKRIVRKCLKWYLEPVCDQQTIFNQATVTVIEGYNAKLQALTETSAMDAELQALREVIEEQNARLQALTETSAVDAELQALREVVKEQDAKLRALTETSAMDAELQALREAVEEQDTKLRGLTETSAMDAELQALREAVEEQNARLQALAETSVMDAELQALREAVEEQRPKYEFGSIVSSSQSGEDTIVAYILDSLKIPFSQCTYLDLGANRPKAMSNSYMFYRFGARGVLVEANPMMIPELERERHGDIILNKCVAETSGEKVRFFVMNGDGLSSPDYDYAEECMRKNPKIQIDKIVSIETISLPDILNQYFRDPPVLVNIDVEGNELKLLQALELQDRRPVIIIVETIPYSPELRVSCKNREVVAYMESMGYAEYAFTGINSIFVDTRRLP